VDRLSILRRGLKRKERVGVSTILASYRSAVAFRQDRFQPVVLAETERIRVLLLCLEPGQAIPVHRPGIDLTLVVLEGDGMMTTGDREDPISSGTVVVVPAGTARGLRATGRLVALAVASPPPTAADHIEGSAAAGRSGRPGVP
jgi:quercetin dioxygenase-like cupin family protein